MTIARSTGALMGTDETTGVTIAAGNSNTATEVDVLADNTSSGEVSLFLTFTPAVIPTKGDLVVSVTDGRVTAKHYQDPLKTWRVPLAGLPASQATIFLGRFKASRYHKAAVKNNGDQSLGNVAVLYALEKTT